MIQVDDGTLKVRVTQVTGPASVAGVALNAHMIKEMALVQVRRRGAPGA